MNDLVSIVIPCYNAEKYIRETINSALNQTYKNIEVLVIDDGSSDNSSNIVKDIMNSDRRVKYIYQENSGVSAARNKGLKTANGEFIAFLDSDDIWFEIKIEKQIDIVERFNSDACYCGYIKWYFESGKKEPKKMKFASENLIELYVKEITWPQTSTWLIKKEFLMKNEILFNEECSWGEDSEFFIKVMAKGKIGYCAEYLVNYRIGEGALSNKHYISYDAIPMWNGLKNWLIINNVENSTALIKYIDQYQIVRIYIDNFFKELRCGKDYKEKFYNEKKKILVAFKPNLNINDFKLAIKAAYIKMKVKNFN